MKRPAFQFYPADWRKDVELRSCSLAARGLWIDLMCVMHECEPYGHLVLNGKPMTPAQIVNQIGGSEGLVRKLLVELLDSGAARKTADGVIYSKRMVEDERVRNARAEGGKVGAEHGKKGAAHGAKGGRPAKQKGGLETPLATDQKPPPSSSSSSSNTSEANASGGEPPTVDLAEVIFGRGVPLLMAAEVPEKNARSMLGLMRKTHGDEALVDALQRCADEKALEPVAFLQGCLKTPKKSAGKHAGFASKNYREGVEADGSLA